MITVEYACADGTPLVVHFRDEVDAAKSWRLDRAHGRDPQTPLGLALMQAALPGVARAYEEVGLPAPANFGPNPDADGFVYYDGEPPSEEYVATMFSGFAGILAEHGSALGLWEGYCRPRTKQACADIAAAGSDVSLDTLAEWQGYGFHMTMLPAFICGNDLDLLTKVVTPLYGEDAKLVAHELSQGFDCETLQADQQLWELGRSARADAAAMAALSGERVAAAMAARRAEGGSPAFFAAVDAYLSEYGHRAEGWDIACPTWDEQRDGFWRQLAHAAADTTPAPRDAVAAAAARRRALVADIEQRLAADEAELARFRRRLARVEPYVAVREDRARWQVGILGALRRAALRRGQALVEGGLLGEAEDALFLVPSEIEAGGGDLRALVAARRAAHEAKCRLEPPRVVGAGPAPDVQTPRPTPEDGVLRGVGGSRGVVTGRARVIVDLEDADRLEVGDVLVCVMTSPPWTPLFGLAGGVVVDSGDLASHPAIAAREYGIPCVLGLAGVTTTIPDGAMVTVDGAAGTVQVLG